MPTRVRGNSETLKKVRITLDLTQPFYERLEELERLVQGGSKADVIRQALRLFEYLVKKTREGCQFKIVTKEGDEESLVIFATVASEPAGRR